MKCWSVSSISVLRDCGSLLYGVSQVGGRRELVVLDPREVVLEPERQGRVRRSQVRGRGEGWAPVVGLESEKLQRRDIKVSTVEERNIHIAVAILMSLSSSVVLGKICLISLLRERFEVGELRKPWHLWRGGPQARIESPQDDKRWAKGSKERVVETWYPTLFPEMKGVLPLPSLVRRDIRIIREEQKKFEVFPFAAPGSHNQ
jgi:hypothetical protein